MNRNKKQLPLIDCGGCGVCCFHMGYPPFIKPRKPLAEQQILEDPDLRAEINADPQKKEELLNGNNGEKWWFQLPDGLKEELEQYVAEYDAPSYEGGLESFDGPCVWLNLETRQCKHHEFRPQVCRDFEVASTQCKEWRREYIAEIRQPEK